MKAIFLLAIILVAASAKLNFKEAYKGFTEEFEFTAEQHQEVKACAVELSQATRTLMAPGKAALQAKLFTLFFADDSTHKDAILNLFQYLQTSFPDCQKFAVSFAQLFAEAGRSEDEQYVSRQALLPYRLQKHSAYILSSVVRLADEIRKGRSQEAGISIAHILEVLTGLEHPETLMDYAKEYKQPIEVAVVEPERFLHQAINTAVKELGYTVEVPEHRIKDLVEALRALALTHYNIQMKLATATSMVERQVITIGAARDLVKTLAVVGENVKLILTPYVQSHHLAQGNLPRTLKTLAHNYFLNLTYIQRKSFDLIMGVRAQHPVETGHAIARLVTLIAGTYSNHPETA